MEMRLSMRPALTVRHDLRLSLAQRHSLAQRLAQIRLDLIGTIRGINYRPEAVCPGCNYRLTLGEIIRGFTTDPQDYTTCCPKCRTRFVSKMVCRDNYSSVEIPFYCATQVLAQMTGLQQLSPEELRRVHPAIYHSAVFHHGTLHNAFSLAGYSYGQDEVADWIEKVIPFLGRLPDTEIAQCVNQPVRLIRARRKKLGIRAFSKREALLEL